jgi:hypothetical protein
MQRGVRPLAKPRAAYTAHGLQADNRQTGMPSIKAQTKGRETQTKAQDGGSYSFPESLRNTTFASEPRLISRTL